jgi:hypothetical protein
MTLEELALLFEEGVGKLNKVDWEFLLPDLAASDDVAGEAMMMQSDSGSQVLPAMLITLSLRPSTMNCVPSSSSGRYAPPGIVSPRQSKRLAASETPNPFVDSSSRRNSRARYLELLCHLSAEVAYLQVYFQRAVNPPSTSA